MNVYESLENITKVELHFPVTGHSFIQAHRVFGFIETAVRKEQEILNPQHYINIIDVANLLEKRFVSEWQQDDRLKFYANVLNSGATEEEAEENYCETGQFINPHD
ncbi:hypothetical protein ANN_21504 [Periplaneta americana]|uniref:Uncharacterized protein n=1 Tax=Periplaneta americana TaxID=6978 RepID=A0ABQ8SFK6_PERAM|nr:hypothetical protein ANN_21504 [Periplaneta americana]